MMEEMTNWGFDGFGAIDGTPHQVKNFREKNLRLVLWLVPSTRTVHSAGRLYNLGLCFGRGFLATRDAVVKVKSSKVTMKVDGQEAGFDVFKAAKLPPHHEEMKAIMAIELKLSHTNL
ncbi:hypothetical protein HAX54_000542 [Datura stramonium]|uniref:Uncharacterized protein n=1 Tax=Datura stramonium TaxID=4076 RepID=A0ABS8T169_DATST|nr:hypothetical protein [Datura stramonium]